MITGAVSACLVSFRRPANLTRIVAELDRLDFVDEILVWNNAPDSPLTLSSPKARVLSGTGNDGCKARFACAALARNPVIYTQDDDVLVHDIPRLYAEFLAHPDVITHALSAWHFPRRREHVHPDGHVALLGWGSFFLKSWLAVLDELPASVRNSALFAREADKYFTVLQHRTHHSVQGSLEQLPGHSDPQTALWLQPDHDEQCALATREALALSRRRHRPFLPVRWNVVITSFDYGRFLAECVRSVLANPADCQITVVDDGSTDDTLAISTDLARRYGGIQVISSRVNRGPSAAANAGIAAVDSAFAIRLDGDDRVGPHYLHAADEVLSGGADIANPDAILFGDQVDRWDVPDHVTLAMLLRHNSIHCASAFRRSIWAQVGGFDEILRRAVDYDLWIRMLRAGARAQRVPGDHFFYRRHAGSLSATGTGRR